MFENTAERVVELMIEHGIIDVSRKVVCTWGMTHLLDTIFNMAVFAVIGAVTGMIGETVLFTSAYIILRVYAGGFHASTPERCCVCSALMLSGALLLISRAEMIGMTYYVMTGVSVILTVVMSPVSSRKKPLYKAERKSYRRCALLVLLAEELLAAAALALHLYRVFYTISAVWMILALMLVLEAFLKSAER